MFGPGIMVLGDVSGGLTRQWLFALLLLAILLMIAGAIMAVVALLSQRKEASKMTILEQLDDEAS